MRKPVACPEGTDLEDVCRNVVAFQSAGNSPSSAKIFFSRLSSALEIDVWASTYPPIKSPVRLCPNPAPGPQVRSVARTSRSGPVSRRMRTDPVNLEKLMHFGPSNSRFQTKLPFIGKIPQIFCIATLNYAYLMRKYFNPVHIFHKSLKNVTYVTDKSVYTWTRTLKSGLKHLTGPGSAWLFTRSRPLSATLLWNGILSVSEIDPSLWHYCSVHEHSSRYDNELDIFDIFCVAASLVRYPYISSRHSRTLLHLDTAWNT